MTKELKDKTLGALKAGDRIFYADVPEAGASGSAAVKEADVLRGWEVEFGGHLVLKTNIPEVSSGDIILASEETEEVLSSPSIVCMKKRIISPSCDGKRVISASREQCVRDVIFCMKKRESILKDKMSSVRDRISEIRRQTAEFKKINRP